MLIDMLFILLLGRQPDATATSSASQAAVTVLKQ